MNDRLTFKNIMVFYESLDDQSKIVSIITTLLTFLLTIGIFLLNITVNAHFLDQDLKAHL